MRIAALTLVSAVLCSAAFSQEGNCPEERRLAAAIRMVRERSNLDLPLQATPEPNLTDDVVYLTTKESVPLLNSEVPAISFYRIAPAGFEIKGDRVVSETVQLDDSSEWLVAVDERSDLKFLLEGSSDPTAEFNKIAQHLRLRVMTSESAVDLFDFFLKVTYGQRFRSQVVGDDMKLQAVALEDFRLRFPSVKRRATFDAWWEKVPAMIKKGISPPRATPAKDGFEIRYYFYSQGNLAQQDLFMSHDGTVREGRSVILFSAASSKLP